MQCLNGMFGHKFKLMFVETLTMMPMLKCHHKVHTISPHHIGSPENCSFKKTKGGGTKRWQQLKQKLRKDRTICARLGKVIHDTQEVYMRMYVLWCSSIF